MDQLIATATRYKLQLVPTNDLVEDAQDDAQEEAAAAAWGEGGGGLLELIKALLANQKKNRGL